MDDVKRQDGLEQLHLAAMNEAEIKDKIDECPEVLFWMGEINQQSEKRLQKWGSENIQQK